LGRLSALWYHAGMKRKLLMLVTYPARRLWLLLREDTLQRIRNRASTDPKSVTQEYVGIPIKVDENVPANTIYLIDDRRLHDISREFNERGNFDLCPSCERYELSRTSPDYICEECRGL
jgi:hypothetical protein